MKIFKQYSKLILIAGGSEVVDSLLPLVLSVGKSSNLGPRLLKGDRVPLRSPDGVRQVVPEVPELVGVSQSAVTSPGEVGQTDYDQVKHQQSEADPSHNNEGRNYPENYRSQEETSSTGGL